jgi:hypothetical protein
MLLFKKFNPETLFCCYFFEFTVFKLSALMQAVLHQNFQTKNYQNNKKANSNPCKHFPSGTAICWSFRAFSFRQHQSNANEQAGGNEKWPKLTAHREMRQLIWCAPVWLGFFR